jgi:hypothetical protein
MEVAACSDHAPLMGLRRRYRRRHHHPRLLRPALRHFHHLSNEVQVVDEIVILRTRLGKTLIVTFVFFFLLRLRCISTVFLSCKEDKRL